MSIKTETTDDRNRFGELMTAADDLVLFRAAVEKEFHRLHGSPELELMAMQMMKWVTAKQLAMQETAFRGRRRRRKPREQVH